jgi:hypothetical protein
MRTSCTSWYNTETNVGDKNETQNFLLSKKEQITNTLRFHYQNMGLDDVAFADVSEVQWWLCIAFLEVTTQVLPTEAGVRLICRPLRDAK